MELGITARDEVVVDVGNELGPVVDAGGHVAGEDEVELGGLHPGVFDVVDFELDVGGGVGGLVGAEVIADDLDGGARELVVVWEGAVMVRRGLRSRRGSLLPWRWPLVAKVSASGGSNTGQYGSLTHACPSADVENPLRLGLVEGREIQTANETGQDVVEEEQALHLLFVVGPRVPWCHKGHGSEPRIDDCRHRAATQTRKRCGRHTSRSKRMIATAMLKGVVDDTRGQGCRIARFAAGETER